MISSPGAVEWSKEVRSGQGSIAGTCQCLALLCYKEHSSIIHRKSTEMYGQRQIQQMEKEREEGDVVYRALISIEN